VDSLKETIPTTLAKDEYRPFGELFPTETDLVYYGYRCYSPVLGRWMSRDTVEKKGGLNLYGFADNDSVNKWEML